MNTSRGRPLTLGLKPDGAPCKTFRMRGTKVLVGPDTVCCDDLRVFVRSMMRVRATLWCLVNRMHDASQIIPPSEGACTPQEGAEACACGLDTRRSITMTGDLDTSIGSEKALEG